MANKIKVSINPEDLRPAQEVLDSHPTIYDKDWWGRTPVVVGCASPGCDDIADAVRMLCDKHFYDLAGVVKVRAAQDPHIRKELPNGDGR